MPNRIVTHAYRPKRPPRKKRAVALPVPAVVRRVAKPRDDTTAAPRPVTSGRKSAIVSTTSKRDGIARRGERADDGQEASPEIKAFFAHMMRPPGS
jgi:hypothetical protein